MTGVTKHSINVEKAALYEAKKREQDQISAQLAIEQQAVSKAQLAKAAEEKMLALMSEFSALGVDLNSNPFCGDKADLTRYNTAKAKYDEIYALAEAYSLDKKYSNFLFHNQQSSKLWLCEELR